MPLPFVTIDVSATNTGTPDALAALVEACDQAFSLGTCRLLPNEPGDAAPDRAVTIQWSGADALGAHVELRATPTAPAELTRDLTFQPSDGMVERWRSVGYVAGTLADESLASRQGTRERSKPAPAPAPARARSPRPAAPRAIATPPAAPTLPRTWIDAQASASRVLNGWRIGGTVRAGHAIEGPLFGVLGTRYSAGSRDVRGVPLELQWLTPSIGVGWRASPDARHFDFGVRLEVTYELTTASARDARTGTTDSARRWAVGAIAGVDAGWRFSEWGELTLGGDTAVTARRIELRIEDQPAGTLPALEARLSAGFRVTFH